MLQVNSLLIQFVFIYAFIHVALIFFLRVISNPLLRLSHLGLRKYIIFSLVMGPIKLIWIILYGSIS